uniref:Beta-1,4-N-acetylgalactosaminyltransferase n=1 Tax=Pygocentrus nattereri TaxID=42514 RepID=A0AAR2IQS7_PYGNA
DKREANLHVFEDWCGSTIAKLRKNLHYPLYPHSRITVKKLAVSPSWTNYGLRMFGYIHPFTDGEFLFAVACDDNCEFWLSQDENPDNLKLSAYVGKAGKEWTAPGEYGKYPSQISQPTVSLSFSLRLQQQKRYYFELIHKQNDHGTDHVEVAWRLKQASTKFILIDSRSISLYTNESSLKMNYVSHIPQTVASHVVLSRDAALSTPHEADMLKEDPRDTFYQISLLDRSHLWGVLPECAYKPSYIIKGFPLLRYQGLQFVRLLYVYPNDYTRLTHMENDNKCFYQERPYYLKREQERGSTAGELPSKYSWRNKSTKLAFRTASGKGSGESAARTRSTPNPKQNSRTGNASLSLRSNSNGSLSHKVKDGSIRLLNGPKPQEHHYAITRDAQQLVDKQMAKELNKSITGHVEMDVVDPPTKENNHSWRRERGAEGEESRFVSKRKQKLSKYEEEDNTVDDWALYGDSESEYDLLNRVGFDREVNWAQTFQVKPLDFQTLRSDWIDLACNVSGNLLISQSEAEAVVQTFMEKLNKKYPSRFTLQRIVNVEKRPDVARGSRYLLELDLLEWSSRRIRLAHYIYVLYNPDQSRGRAINKQSNHPQLLLCSPHNFQWNPRATVHFIVPVKNQARWVQQFIVDMEELYRATGDSNFNIIITDYDSTDMDIEKALKNSHLPSYQYLRLKGNFQRSAGLQAGIDIITDEHSIVFLCDLHIHFPLGFIDSVRRHCVEGRMAFAPIVMRLNCGATPQEPDGYWEVNGFGLLGIYKSDLDSIGGMNTKDFTVRWGGEDWELLDRILQTGMEVERLYLRNFFHYYHSRRGMWNRRIVPDT